MLIYGVIFLRNLEKVTSIPGVLETFGTTAICFDILYNCRFTEISLIFTNGHILIDKSSKVGKWYFSKIFWVLKTGWALRTLTLSNQYSTQKWENYLRIMWNDTGMNNHNKFLVSRIFLQDPMKYESLLILNILKKNFDWCKSCFLYWYFGMK